MSALVWSVIHVVVNGILVIAVYAHFKLTDSKIQELRRGLASSAQRINALEVSRDNHAQWINRITTIQNKTPERPF